MPNVDESKLPNGLQFPRSVLPAAVGWTIDFGYLSKLQGDIQDDEDAGTPSLETIEAILLAAERAYDPRDNTSQSEDEGCSFGRRIDPDTLASICDTHGKVCGEDQSEVSILDCEQIGQGPCKVFRRTTNGSIICEDCGKPVHHAVQALRVTDSDEWQRAVDNVARLLCDTEEISLRENYDTLREEDKQQYRAEAYAMMIGGAP